MSHSHQSSESGNQGGSHHPKPPGKKLHRDWRVWVGVILMLGCMIIYLLTLDEAIVPGGSPAGNTTVTNAPAQP